ncbi:restriction endonuclease subunit S [Corallococcus sp. RDP092CA]|uniref:restriction endonuclease subunit S n=1 Tax=Corallococcus sp. RDP092CA TaxID=3109369 RepID=UPI0035B3B1F3
MNALREAPIAVPWLGILRADWPLVPLRYLVRFLSGGTPDKGNADFWSGGTIPWVSPKDMKVDRINDSEDHITVAALDGSATQLVPVGSVLVVVRGMILAHTLPVAVTTGPVTINQDIKALVCGQPILPEFLHAVLAGQAEWLLSQADSSAHGTKKLETEVLQRFEVPCPPLDLQRRIIAAMRAQAMGLDEVVAAKQRVLDLLAEKRKAIIATAVTRGLDPKVKLRDSGVPWLGVTPAHWELWKVGHLAKVGNGSTPERDKVAYWSEGSFPWLNSSVVNQEEVTSSDQFVTDAALRECHLPRLRPGTVLVAITGQGKTRGQAVVLSIEATINQHMAFVAPDPALVDAWFLRWSFYRAYDYLRSISDDAGGTKGALTCEDVAGLRIPVPPPDEQRTIVEHIARETAQLDAVRAATERTIALLKERRSALIAAAVTGQLDVGAAA